MSLLFETIKCQNRQLFNLDYHAIRVRNSLENLGIISDFDFENTIKIPDWVGQGLYRCRVSYGEEIEKIDFFSYQFKHPKIIQLLENQTFSYQNKFEDRSFFQAILKENQGVDEVIITQNNFITDATYANVAFFDGAKWFTPTTYLLAGTKRAYLLDNQLITEAEISISDLKKFKKIAFINAMRDLDLAYHFSLQSKQIRIDVTA